MTVSGQLKYRTAMIIPYLLHGAAWRRKSRTWIVEIICIVMGCILGQSHELKAWLVYVEHPCFGGSCRHHYNCILPYAQHTCQTNPSGCSDRLTMTQGSISSRLLTHSSSMVLLTNLC